MHRPHIALALSLTFLGGCPAAGDDDDDTGDLPSCAAILEADSAAESGVYSIDHDGDGESFDVTCDMETDGGGWTLFWWAEPNADVWDSAEDVLGQDLDECDVSGEHCFAIIPDDGVVEFLAANDSHWASWDLTEASGTQGNARAAFLERTQTPFQLDRYDGVWNPARLSDSLDADYACSGTSQFGPPDGNCNQFWYGPMWSSVLGQEVLSFNLDDDGGWGYQAFAAGADNASYLGVDFFDVTSLNASGGRGGRLLYL